MVNRNLIFEGNRIGYRNFSGRPGDYNKEGDRNFCVFLDRDTGISLKEEGWNIRWTKPRDDQEDPVPYLPVKVSFKVIPGIPRINVVMISSRGRTKLDEESIKELDYAEIENTKLMIRPYNYPRIAGREAGIAAYLRSMEITIMDDPFESKFHDPPEIAGVFTGEDLCNDCEQPCGSKGACRNVD